ncbi:MAG: endolytic transglycosylase MltG [Nitrospinae bacterium]|nr:endolytic transglycosylase MltG [Nitrospinota bacterium]
MFHGRPRRPSTSTSISSVFHNRLRKKMPLQTDPTVIYALRENFDGNLRKKDLSIDSPYNTYKHIGLPPGPVASPGLKSVIAALYPAQTDYLYFVSRQDGGHQFSANLIDHNRAVAEFQLKKSGKP